MIKALPITEARKEFTKFPEEFEKNPNISAIEITNHGRAVFAIIPIHLFEAIAETLEIMTDQGEMTALRQGIEEVKSGNVVDWDAVKGEFGL